MSDLHEIIIHTDGACSGNPGPGGWSACLDHQSPDGTHRILLRGGDPDTTNNAMELAGAANGLAYALDLIGPGSARILLRTDSEYLLKGLRDWSVSWKRKGWRTASGHPVKNRDLWERLCDLRDRAEVVGAFELVHVRGHSGDPGNEEADKAAVAARDLSRRRPGPWQDPPKEVGPGSAPDTAPVETAPAEEAARFEREAAQRGYRRYRDPFHHSKSGYLFSMQLRVRDGEDTLYFLNVDAWDMGALSRGQVSRLSLEANAQFHTENDNAGRHVNVSTPFEGFEETETFFGRMWSSMGFGRYERADPGPEA